MYKISREDMKKIAWGLNRVIDIRRNSIFDPEIQAGYNSEYSTMTRESLSDWYADLVMQPDVLNDEGVSRKPLRFNGYG